MRKIILGSLLLIIASLLIFSYSPTDEKIHWLSINQVDALYAKEPRPLLIDVYTDWCGWCKVMDKKTYTDDRVADYINKNFYAVKIDAETQETLTLNGKVYTYDAANKVNNLAIYLLGGQMQYPTTVFMSTLSDRPAPLAGYLKPEDMEAPLKFFGEKAHLKMNFQDFSRGLKKEW